MKLNKLFVCCVLLCVVISVFTGCRNNLVNEWENYTGDTDVYYNEPDETSVPKFTSDKIEDITEYGLPEYWTEELLTTVKDSRKAIKNANGDCTSFLWYSDAHWSYSSRRSVQILQLLQDYTNVQFVNFGGDIVSDNDKVEHSKIISQLKDWREKTLSLNNHHSVVGNHDDGLEEFKSRKDLYNFLLMDEVGKKADLNNNFCYYVDNVAEKTRYIYLSTGFDETTADDIRFLVNTLNSTKKDWHIVAVSHIWFVYNDTSTPTEGKVPEFAQVILNVLDDYNTRSTGKENGVEYDFNSAKAKVEFCIGGHTHVDFDFYTDGGIPVILNETDSFHLRGKNKKNDGTDESSVSVIVADYNSQEIHIVRAGRGKSRTVSLSEDK